jgi:hypothetical protein
MAARRRIVELRMSVLAITFAAHPGWPTSSHAASATLWGWVIVALLVLVLLAVGLYALRRMR